MRKVGWDECDRPWLTLCEGEADKKLLDRLIEHHAIGSSFQVEFVNGRARSDLGSVHYVTYQSHIGKKSRLSC